MEAEGAAAGDAAARAAAPAPVAGCRACPRVRLALPEGGGAAPGKRRLGRRWASAAVRPPPPAMADDAPPEPKRARVGSASASEASEAEGADTTDATTLVFCDAGAGVPDVRAPPLFTHQIFENERVAGYEGEGGGGRGGGCARRHSSGARAARGWGRPARSRRCDRGAAATIRCRWGGRRAAGRDASARAAGS